MNHPINGPLLVIGMGPNAQTVDALAIQSQLRDKGIEALIIANCTALVMIEGNP
jgi:hypothetical protein